MSTGISFSNKGLQSVCPTGITTFDRLIGGGFALTSINVIDEDYFRTYSSMLCKAYLSSAIIAEQDVIIFSPNINSKKSRFIRELPTLQNSNECEKTSDESMKIAFRYSNLPSRFLSENDGEDTFNKKLDFGTYLESEIVEKANIQFYNHSDIFKVLKDKLKDSSKNVCRILIDELGSPLSDLPAENLPKICHQLKILLRNLSQSVCLATLVSSDTYNENIDLLESVAPSVRDQIHFVVDSVVRLQCFEKENDDQNPYSSDYVGFVQLLKLPYLNSFAPYNPSLETTEFGIKLRNSKRFLAIEKLALPPDLGETVNRFTSSVKMSDTITCGSNNNTAMSNKLTNF